MTILSRKILASWVRCSAAFVLMTGLAAQPATAATATETVKGFFAGLKTLKAEFEQQVHNSKFKATEISRGSLVIQRPGRFRWDYRSPYVQQIVGDGSKIWIYDADLEQVTVRKMGLALGNTPAVLLSDEQPLETAFVLKEIGEKLGATWLELTPKDKEAAFSAIRLGVTAGVLTHMELVDSLGQTTSLTFSQTRRNVPVDANAFKFTPPPGADVFDETK